MKGNSQSLKLPNQLWLISLLIGLLGWSCSATRHWLLQSNAYDLGLFDQWAWLVSKGLPPVSTMEGVHLLADHAAWWLYLSGALYAIQPSLDWLLASQALALSFTAIPIWMLAAQARLPRKLCWLACLLWWLQPVVFNCNLFDFHPEVWGMPVLALALWAERAGRPILWITLLLSLLGFRDGLLLIIAGMAIEQAWRRRWRWSTAATLVSGGWLLMLSRWLYPWLRHGEGPKAAAQMFGHLNGNPVEVLSSLDWIGGAFYLLLLALPCGVLWKRTSLPVLLIGLPLVVVNLLSSSSSYRTLIHHYSLPLAVIAVVAAIDGLAAGERKGRSLSRKRRSLIVGWAILCWLALAKPWFFTGPYLDRLGMRQDATEAISLVPSRARVLSTSYLAPHLTQRQWIAFPKKQSEKLLTTGNWKALLLNPDDAGWGSTKTIQTDLLKQAHRNGWKCRKWSSGLELCLAPDGAQVPPLHNE
ncbi:uncharacterized conserved membrane protein (DUF2079) [Synechococcus sp. MIT S9220]|uniref:DUF2079 domain-containing protein n=1 Tax=unclassified Synechococcus TaxID=2626047 RepID=UPI00164B63A0|nr:DUF2079 domain-containing protein [Synechococcus sp. MIT S9220]QNJ24060.1 uncharacterized conserved membrane protein (DUF2079) [Synechococcus sp. MIT S9220]